MRSSCFLNSSYAKEHFSINLTQQELIDFIQYLKINLPNMFEFLDYRTDFISDNHKVSHFVFKNVDLDITGFKMDFPKFPKRHDFLCMLVMRNMEKPFDLGGCWDYVESEFVEVC